MQKSRDLLHRAFFRFGPHCPPAVDIIQNLKKIISFRENFWSGKLSKTVLSSIPESLENARKALCYNALRGFQKLKTFLETVC